MEATNALFADFPSFTKEDWKKQILKDLKGARFEDHQITNGLDDFAIDSLYAIEETSSLDYLSFYQTPASGTDSESPRNWRNLQLIPFENETQANQVALQALNAGAEEIKFDLRRAKVLNWNSLLQGIQLPYCALSFVLGSDQIDFLAEYWQYTLNQGIDPKTMSGSVEWEGELSLEAAQRGIEISREAADFAVLSISSTSTSAKPSDQLADLMLAAGKWIDRLSGKAIDSALILKNIVFLVPIHSNYFVEIARLRALRILFTEMASVSLRRNVLPSEAKIYAVSSIRIDEKTQTDPYLNMLSNTTQAMSAIIGGCQVLHVKPYNEGIEAVTHLAERIARNVSVILKEESHLDKVIDPSAGSYFLDWLTDQIAETAWKKMTASLA
jgi:methylmalonyl-CoA mutase